jgi:hypothetical protein
MQDTNQFGQQIIRDDNVGTLKGASAKPNGHIRHEGGRLEDISQAIQSSQSL